MNREICLMVILGMSISLIMKKEFSGQKLQETLGKTFDGTIKYDEFFNSIDEIEIKCMSLIKQIKNQTDKK